MDKIVCLQFCAYYKPGKQEELSCGGYQAIDRLLRQGKRLSVEVTGSRCSVEDRERIVNAVCATCGFREDGCDFILDRAAPPCGGFRMLSLLIADSVLRIEDL